jgi:hypothetical protein
MGNKCMRPTMALDNSSHGTESPAFFQLRFPEKHRCVCELEAAVTVLSAVAHGNQATGPMVWDDYDCVSHRSVVNCLENQMMHLKMSSVVDGGKRRVGSSPRKQVSVCETVEILERWGDAGAFLFANIDIHLSAAAPAASPPP